MDSHWDTNKAVARGNNAATLTALPMLSMALVLLPPALYKYVVHWLATLISIASDLDIDLYVESCGGSAAVDSVGAAASSSAHFRRALDCCCCCPCSAAAAATCSSAVAVDCDCCPALGQHLLASMTTWLALGATSSLVW